MRVGCTAALLNSAYSGAGELLHHQSGDEALLQPSSVSHVGVMYKHTLNVCHYFLPTRILLDEVLLTLKTLTIV